MDTRLSAPPMWRPKKSSAKTSKALIVGADFFALTSRVDPQVVFWDVNQAFRIHQIPVDVTILWVADDVDLDVRKNLLTQALQRGLEAWKDEDGRALSILEVRRKLLPIWKHDYNRTMVYPAVDAGPDELLGQERQRQSARQRAEEERLLFIREAAERFAVREEKARVRSEKKLNEALSRLSLLDRKVYESYIRHEDKNGDRMEVVGKEFGFHKANIERIVRRVESKISEG